MCLSGYLKIDGQIKCKGQEAATRGLQRLLKGGKIEKKLLLLETAWLSPTETKVVAPSLDFESVICVSSQTHHLCLLKHK